MTCLSNLPSEIVREILSHLEIPELLAFCLVARSFLRESQCALFRSVRLEDRHVTMLMSNASHHVSLIRNLHALIDVGFVMPMTRTDSANWVQLFMSLKLTSAATNGKIPADIDKALAEMKSIPTLLSIHAQFPSHFHPWPYATRWGERLKGLRILGPSRKIEVFQRPDPQYTRPILQTLEIEGILYPWSAFLQFFDVRRVRRLSIRDIQRNTDGPDVLEEMIREVSQSLHILTVASNCLREYGSNFLGNEMTFPDLRILSISISEPSILKFGPSHAQPFAESIASRAPKLHTLRLYFHAHRPFVEGETMEDRYVKWDTSSFGEAIGALQIKRLQVWLKETVTAGNPTPRDVFDVNMRRLFPRFADQGTLEMKWDVEWYRAWPLFEF
ncbi:hypothetical protein DL96DRAFT_1740409 [Flagelloscypha sp. PMI_526]|nr:hypothetical protein DL96DRAFT_1740409 [Flagelloscypha sp. PMI_526]